MGGKLAVWAREEATRHEKQALALKFQREQMVQRQRAQRRELDTMQAQRQEDEQRQRAARVPKGFKGLWGWVTGQNRRIRLQNEMEALRAQDRDRAERETMIQKQLAERRILQGRIKIARAQQHGSIQELTREVAHYARLGRNAPPSPPLAKEPKRSRNRKTGRERERGSGRGDAPELEL